MKRTDLGTMVRRNLLPEYRLRPLDMGGDGSLSAKGFNFLTKTYEVEGLGHLCVMSMKAMAGLMKMETVVLSCFERDMPLLNLDWVSVPGKETQIVELYDTQISPLPKELLDAFDAVKSRDSDITDYVPKGEHAYDELKYRESYQKTSAKASGRMSEAAEDYMRIFMQGLHEASPCDPSGKREKVSAFAGRLISDGGAAVDQMTKLFGRETTERIVRRHMYGV